MRAMLWPQALFLGCVALRLGASLEMPAAGAGAALCALGGALLARRPAPPTPGLSFIILATGALLGYLGLGELATPGSWPAAYPTVGGLCLAVLVLLLWLLAAHAPPRHDRPLGAETQTLLVGGLMLLLLLPLPPAPPIHAVALAPLGLGAALIVLVHGHGQGLMRAALLAPVLMLAPAAALPLGEAPRPLVRLLWRLMPQVEVRAVGYNPQQPLRALAFLSPSDQPVLRLRARGAVPRYLAGNRLVRLNGRSYTWQAAPAPAAGAPVRRAADGLDWYPLGAGGTTQWRADVEPLDTSGLVFLAPGTHAVGLAGAKLAAGEQGVLLARFDADARRHYVLEGGAPLSQELERNQPLHALPEFWDAELDAAARRLRGRDATDTARRIAAHFRTRAYSLDTRLDERRPFHDFFLSGKPAYCFWYATGAALALRANGIPARVVAGYLVSERLGAGLWIVRERDAHAWTEWLDAGGRWHTLDATPPSYGEFLEAHRSGAWRRLHDRIAAAWSLWTAGFGLGERTERGLIVLGLAVLAGLFVREYRRLQRAPRGAAAVDPRLRRLWARFLRASGLPEEPAWTAADYGAHLPPRWSPARRAAAAAFLDAWGLARFGPGPTPLGELEALLRRLRRTA